MLIGICGVAGSGKDSCADILVKKHSFVKIAFADVLKRICQDVFDFTDDQLFNSSENRAKPSEYYNCETKQYLTPRLALQSLGDWGRNCYSDIWINYTLEAAKRISQGFMYNQKKGILKPYDYQLVPGISVVISDVRYNNELDAIKKNGGKVIRIVRAYSGLRDQNSLHSSETEQTKIPDSSFDFIIENNGTLADLELKVDNIVSEMLRIT